MTEAEKIEACARAAHEALRALAFARGDHVAAPWMALSAEDQLRVVLATERALSDILEVPDDEFASDAAEELARLMVEGAKPFLPDVEPKAEPQLMRRWSKKAKAIRDENKRLVPWDWEEAA